MKRIGRILLPLLVLLLFLLGLSGMERGRSAEGKRQLEETLRRTAAACYALEGAYPPSLDYMQEHYGLQWDEETYTVRYEIFASNLMPDITVMEKLP